MLKNKNKKKPVYSKITINKLKDKKKTEKNVKKELIINLSN